MNLIIFVVMYITTSFSYYLINFYIKYMPGDIFTNQAANSLAEALVQVCPVFMVKYMSV